MRVRVGTRGQRGLRVSLSARLPTIDRRVARAELLDQKLDGVEMALGRRQVQRGALVVIVGVDEEVLLLHEPPEGGAVASGRRVAQVGGHAGGRIGRHLANPAANVAQILFDLVVPVPDRIVERRAAEAVHGGGISMKLFDECREQREPALARTAKASFDLSSSG